MVVPGWHKTVENFFSRKTGSSPDDTSNIRSPKFRDPPKYKKFS